MPFNTLIIDDEMPERKGYGRIEERYPGMFAVDLSRRFVSPDTDETAAVHRLNIRCYDLILLDFSFDVHPEQGMEMLMKIRKGVFGANSQAYIIGTSSSWDGALQTGVLRSLKNRGMLRGLDGFTGKDRDNAQGLFEELDRFLALRVADPESAKRK